MVTITHTQATLSKSAEAGRPNRRHEERNPLECRLWLVDHYGKTVLPCYGVEASENGMRLRVPVGYGVAEGQRYELRSHQPGSRPAGEFGLLGRRWATVVRTNLQLDAGAAYVEVGLRLDPAVHLPAS